VTVAAIDDLDYEPEGGTTLYFEPITSQDPLYQEVFPSSGRANIVDNDAAPANDPPVATALSTQVWEDAPNAEIQGLGYDTGEFGIVEYEIVSQPVAGGTVTLDPSDGRTFRFEGDKAFLSALNRGETKDVTFEYRVSDGELWSAPEKITFKVHGITNGANETVIATVNSTDSQKDFFPFNGGDGNDTLVFQSVQLTEGAGLKIKLGEQIKWTQFDGKLIKDFENITINATTGQAGRTLTVEGDDQANVFNLSGITRKLFVNGLNGDDAFNFGGSGTEAPNSIITGGSGSDTVNASSAVWINDQANGGGASGDDFYNLGAGVQHLQFFGSNGNDTITNFQRGATGDKLHFLGGTTVTAAMNGADTVITTNTGGKVTVKNVALTANDWLFT
jgi:VCBS repeat-containing protein